MTGYRNYIRTLGSLIGTGAIIEVDRSPMTRFTLLGFPLEVSEEFMLLQNISDEYLLNGYSIIRMADVGGYRVLEDRGEMIRYVLERRYPEGYLASSPFASEELEDFSFLESIHNHAPLITVHKEGIDDMVCWIGAVSSISEKTFTLRKVDVSGDWMDERGRYRYDDVTRIDFGGAYEEALWMYVSRDSEDGDA